MKQAIRIAVVVLGLTAGAGLLEGGAKVTIRTIGYNGWDNAVEMTNGTARCVVVPSIGRIMFYGFHGGDNVLWNNPACFGTMLSEGKPAEQNGEPVWTNFGGDKVWPTEQSQWPKTNGNGWPPDPWFDGSAHAVRLLPDGVEITSPVSGFNGGRSIREIRLARKGTRLSIRQRIEKVEPAKVAAAEPVPFTVWNITQIRPPEQILYPRSASGKFPAGYYDYSNEKREAEKNVTVENRVVVFTPDPLNAQKTGTDAEPWLAGIANGVCFVECFKRDAKGEYPDGGLTATVYTCPDYTELELMSAFKRLRVGETMKFDIAWELARLPDAYRTAAERREAALKWLKGRKL